MGCDIALVAQIFLLAGVLIRKYNFVERTGLKTCAVLTLILIVAFIFNEHVDINERNYGKALMFYAGDLAGTLPMMKFSALITNVSGKICALIKTYGRQSMMILVMHLIILSVLYGILADTLHFTNEEIFTDAAIIFIETVLGTLIPPVVAKKFGRLPVLKHFCA